MSEENEDWQPAADLQQLSRTHRITEITVSGVSADQLPISEKTQQRIARGLEKHFGDNVQRLFIFPFDAFEMHGCRNLNDAGEPDREGKTVEQVDSEDEATYFALYGHVPGRGLEWLWDFPTKSEAETGLVALNAMLGFITRSREKKQPSFANGETFTIEDNR